LQDISILPGRIRLKNLKLYNNKSLARYLNCQLDNLYGVKNSNVNYNLATILIEFDPKKTNIQKLKQNIEELVNIKFLAKSKEFDEFDEYKELLQKRDIAKRNFIIFGLIYIAFKVKQALNGKFSFSSSVTVLKVASIVTIIGGYPLLKKLYSSLFKSLPVNSDLLYYTVALSSTLMRESSKGVFVLMLKHLNDFKKYSADANNKSLLWQSMKDGKGLPWEKSDTPEEKLSIYKRVRDYQDKVTYISLSLGTISFIISGNLLFALSTLLTLSPKASGTALHAGMKNYLVLLNKHDIYLRNLNAIEKLANLKQIVFDKTGTLTDTEDADALRPDSSEMIRKLKQLGFNKITMITADTEEKAAKTAGELGISDFYSNCKNEDKERLILEFKKSGTVLMVGDGINDINAMRYADVSVSFINYSCDKIKLQSDCIILHDDMVKLVDLIVLSQKAYAGIKQNITFAQGYNILWGVIASFGHINAFTAKSINTLNSLIVLLLNKRIEYLGKSSQFESIEKYKTKYQIE
jgi:cation transport ATPase